MEFKIINEFKADKFIRNKSKLNILKHMLLQKKVTHSVVKNFFLMIYFLYFRISLELGTAMMTRLEAFIVNGIFTLILLATIDQGSRFLFSALVKLLGLIKEILWIYQNIEEVRKLAENK